jgi:hypothetical protein
MEAKGVNRDGTGSRPNAEQQEQSTLGALPGLSHRRCSDAGRLGFEVQVWQQRCGQRIFVDLIVTGHHLTSQVRDQGGTHVRRLMRGTPCTEQFLSGRRE